MTQKDYIVLAAAIRKEFVVASVAEQAILDRLIQRIADTLANDNPRFNRTLFMRACGYTV